VIPKTCVKSFNSLVDQQKVYQYILDVVFAIDEQGIFQYVSPSCLQLFGYSDEEMTGASFLNFIHPDDIEKTLQISSERIHDCRLSNFENRYIRKDSSIVPVILSGKWDENARILYCVARYGSEMIEQQHRMRRAQQMARFAHFEYNALEQYFYYVSEMFYEICGLSPLKYPRVDTKLFEDLIHPDNRSHVLQQFFDYQRGRHSLTEYRIVRPDGMIVHISHQRELIFNNEGQHVKTIGIIQDITNQKIGELALQQSEERFKSLVQNGNDLLGIVDQQGNYTFIGAIVQELIGKNALAFIHPEDVSSLADTLQEITGTKSVTTRPYRFQNCKGEWRWVETTVSNRLENPAIRGFVVNSRDVTEKKQKDDELKKLSLIAQESCSPMVITNLSNEITWVNNSLLQLSGFSFEEMIGKRPQEAFISGDMDDATYQQVQKDLQAGKTITNEARFFNLFGIEY
jgi:PAS domain S-box-containing protein